MDAHTRATVTNAQEITSVVSDIVLEHAASRPSNTAKQYEPKQAEFKQWCATKKYDDGCLVYEGKLVTFLKTYIIPRGNKRRKGGNGQGQPLGIASIEAYAKAVIDLYKLQQSLRTNSHPHPRGKAFHDLFDTLKRNETERKRTQYVDRGLGTILDGYNMEDMNQLSDFWMSENDGDSLRDRADFFLGHALLARGETRRFIELPDMLSLELPDEGPQLCTPLLILMNRGKTNQHGRIEYGAALRCKTELICPLNAVACHLFWRWQINLEPFPDLSCRKNWYDIRLINGSDPTKDMPYNTQLNRIKRAFGACGIDSTVWTHANRGSGAKLAEAYGASEEQIRRLGRWNAARMEGCYLTSLPKKAMRALAGFPTKGGSYWLQRACVVPSDDLQRLVFPDVEKSEELIASNDKPEIAAHAFLKMLKHMRVVFLQVSIKMREKYPNHRLWKHPLFSSMEYISFRKEATAASASAMSTPELHTLESVVPQLATMLSENFKLLSGKIDALAAGVGSIRDLSKKRLVVRWEDIESGDSSDIAACVNSQTRISAARCEETSGTSVKLSRSVRTVVDLWREYTEGVGGQMSIADADKRLGTRWRQNPTESRFYLRRKKYYDAIISMATRDDITRESAAEKLELERSRSGLSLNAFTKKLDDLTR